jgi:hypothetical protein
MSVSWAISEMPASPLIAPRHHNALKSSGTSPNFLITLASLKLPVAGSPVRLNATAPTWPSLRDNASARITTATGLGVRNCLHQFADLVF